VVTNGEINELKMQIHEIEAQTKMFHSKVQRMKRLVKVHGGQPRKLAQNPQYTAQGHSRSGQDALLRQLGEEKSMLQSTVAVSEKKLADLKKSDKYSLTRELRVEIPLVYADVQRLKEDTAELKKIESELRADLKGCRMRAASKAKNEQAIDEIQLKIDDLTEKLFAYKKSEMKIKTASELQKLKRRPSSYDRLLGRVENEVSQLKAYIRAERKELERIEDSEGAQMDYLSRVIEEQEETVRRLLSGRESVCGCSDKSVGESGVNGPKADSVKDG
jgi:hypothetical protein